MKRYNKKLKNVKIIVAAATVIGCTMASTQTTSAFSPQSILGISRGFSDLSSSLSKFFRNLGSSIRLATSKLTFSSSSSKSNSTSSSTASTATSLGTTANPSDTSSRRVGRKLPPGSKPPRPLPRKTGLWEWKKD